MLDVHLLNIQAMSKIIPLFTVAIYWDFENVRLESYPIKCLIGWAQSKGRLVTQKVYSHWGKEHQRFKVILDRHGFQQIDVLEERKNSADMKLKYECREELFSDNSPNIFIIISGDGGFASLVKELQSQGKYVIGVGWRNTSKQTLIDRANEFHFAEELGKLAG